jgi:epoxyqueuosine reductase
MDITAKNIKGIVLERGADLCGIAPVSRFKEAPTGFHPRDLYSDCESVVVFAAHFPLSTLKTRSPSPYTFMRNRMVEKLDEISYALCEAMENNGLEAIPIPSASPYDYWDSDNREGRGILSLKHAGVLAGLGVMGRNTLLVNEIYGNMIWLGAVLLHISLEPDQVADYEVCKSTCKICLEACPWNALDGTTINQRLCREHSIISSEGGGWRLSCNLCRKICPNHKGLKNADQNYRRILS